MLSGPFNATRHMQKPLPQPNYSFMNAPKASEDFEGSSLHHITDRNHFHEAMAEMLLLCKEAIRRRPGASQGGGKPLSLEYLADRLDIDDPCFGFLVRTKEQLGRRENPTWKKGMLQGFITVTTFTNWQKSFKWDSLNQAAYEFDYTNEEVYRAPDRKKDVNGSLSRELQATVRGGDINVEGIVWPRIAEISLLGGLGCGKSLINLVVEHLECMKPTSKANYDYLVLQATDNSISFYESMGFVRVGAVMLDEVNAKLPATDGETVNVETEETPLLTNAVSLYTAINGDTLTRIAAKFDVDVWDLIFLNKHMLGEALPSSKPKLSTVLFIPAKQIPETDEAIPLEETKWYITKDNDTPRLIAKLHNVSCLDIVNGNKSRLPGLISNSRLKEGTKVKLSNFGSVDNEYSAYAHWSFPDSEYEEPEPSYMMVRKLNRRKGVERKYRPFEDSLKSDISAYEPTPLLIPPSPLRTNLQPQTSTKVPKLSAKGSHNIIKPPKRPLSAFMQFSMDQRSFSGSKSTGMNSNTRDLWNDLHESVKDDYERKAQTAMTLYREERGKCQTNNTISHDSDDPEGISSLRTSLYNKVVRLKPGAITEGSEFTYWYVLTYIPDLKWCHLAPMVQDGTFGQDRPKALGKPKWRLVDESLCKEVDISSSFCVPIKSRPMRKTLDADKEEWNIVDDGTDPTIVSSSCSRPDRLFAPASRGIIAVKPSAERARKKSVSSFQSPSLLATLPGSGIISLVRIVGSRLFDAADCVSLRKRGRPKGSKNKAKTLEDSIFSPVVAPKIDTCTTGISSPRDGRRKRRISFVQSNTPASARKAAALRSTVAKRPRGRPPRSSTPIPAPSPKKEIVQLEVISQRGSSDDKESTGIGEGLTRSSLRKTRSNRQLGFDCVDNGDQNFEPIVKSRRSRRSESSCLLLETPINITDSIPTRRNIPASASVAKSKTSTSSKEQSRQKRKSPEVSLPPRKRRSIR